MNLFIKFMIQLGIYIRKGIHMKKRETYNLILTCLSSLSYNAKNDIINGQQPKLYTYFENDKKIADGIMTNEAATKYIFRLLKEKNETVDAIYYVATQKVSKISELGKTDVDFFKERMELYCIEEKMVVPKFLHPSNPMSDEPSGRDLVNLSVEIAEKIREIKETNNVVKINLYIDANGGFRDFLSIVTAVLRTMDGDKIHIEKVIGVNVDNGNKIGKYVDKTEAYQIYDLYSGIDEFINYGRSRMIEQYFNESLNKNNSDNLTKEMKNVIDAITEMSNSFVLCRPLLMLKKTVELKSAIDDYDDSTDKTEVFTFIVAKIKGVYETIFKSIEQGNIYDYSTIKEIMSYCINKNLIQQVLTIYSECMPDILYKYKIIYPGKRVKKGYDQYYNYLNDKSMDGYPYSKEYTFIQQFLNAFNLKEIKGEDRNELLITKGILGQYVDFVKNNNRKTGKRERSYFEKGNVEHQRSYLKGMYLNDFLYSDYDKDKVIEIIIKYGEIKSLRNLSNHADRKESDEKKQNIEHIKNILRVELKKIDELLGK